MKISSKRAEYVALAGLCITFLFFAACWLVGAFNQIAAVKFLAWQILGGAFIWLYLVILFHNKGLAEQEKLEMQMLAKSADSSTIFQGSEERKSLLSIAQNRLGFYQKYFTPIFSVFIGIYGILLGVYLFKAAGVALEERIKYPLPTACILAVIAFFCFLISRYSTGMSSEKSWKPLKAGGSYLLASALLTFGLSIALGFAFFHVSKLLIAMTWVVPSVMVVIGAEISLNTVFDIYRPRVRGQYHRPPFDSRILAIFNEPGGILHTAAHTLDYQFGFKVSQTWFYKLLEKAIFPLMIFAILALYLLSCFVVVNPGQQGIIEHFGSFDNGGRIVGPGLHVKWPWPVDNVYIEDTERIHQLEVGYLQGGKDTDSDMVSRKPLLWGEKHYEYEYQLLVATDVEKAEKEGAVPVSIVIAAVPVQYKVKNIYDYVYNHASPKAMLEAVCYRELVRYAASAKIETETFAEDNKVYQESLLGAGRGEAAKVLALRIQDKADEIGLGVEIVSVGLQGVHPPVDVAVDYENVIGSVQQRQATILEAIAEKNRTLTLLGGDIDEVNVLYELVLKYEDRKVSATDEEVEQMLSDIDVALRSAKGDIFKELALAESYAFEKATVAQATGERFHSQVLAYRAAPEIYKQEQRLKMLEEALEKIRKYIVVTDENDSEVVIVDLKQELAPSLYEIDVPQD